MAGRVPAIHEAARDPRVKPGDDVDRPMASRSTSVEPQIDDVLRVGLQLALFDPGHDVGQDLVGRGRHAGLLSLARDKAVQELDLGAAALEHVLAGRRAMLAAAGPVRLGQTMLVDFLDCRRVALTGAGDRLRVHVADFVKGVAKRLADADRLAAEPGREMANRVVFYHFAGDQPSAGRQPIAHDVGDELRPALAPQILGHHRAVGVADKPADFLGPVGDAAVHLANAEYSVARARFAGGAAHLARRMQFYGDRAGDRAQGLAPSDDAGNCLFVHAILQRHAIPAGGQVLLDHRRRPGGVVGLHADKGDVDRRFFAELLRLGQVQRARPDGERLDIADMGDPQTVLADGFDVLRPRVDIGYVLAGLHHMSSGITTNRSRANDRYLLLRHHVFSRINIAA